MHVCVLLFTSLRLCFWVASMCYASGRGQHGTRPCQQLQALPIRPSLTSASAPLVWEASVSDSSGMTMRASPSSPPASAIMRPSVGTVSWSRGWGGAGQDGRRVSRLVGGQGRVARLNRLSPRTAVQDCNDPQA